MFQKNTSAAKENVENQTIGLVVCLRRPTLATKRLIWISVCKMLTDSVQRASLHVSFLHMLVFDRL